MSIHVTDSEGRSWQVSREWFGLPRWSRRQSSLDEALDTASWLPGDLGGSVADDLASALLAVVVAVIAIAVLAIVVWLVLPVVVLFIGLVVAVVGVGARVLSLAAWTVTARAGATRLDWRVRGVRRSRRAMRDVATALARGVTPAVDGIPGNAG